MSIEFLGTINDDCQFRRKWQRSFCHRRGNDGALHSPGGGRDNEVVVATTNQVVQNADVTRHAELIALSEAQKTLGTKNLSACTLYTIVEPCAMCSFAIRETRIGRVVFSIKSPMMGGLSKWNVLRGTEASHALPEVFGPYLR